MEFIQHCLTIAKAMLAELLNKHVCLSLRKVIKMNEIDQFLEVFSKSTQISYRSHLRNFFKAIDANPETYLDEERDYKADVTKFWMSMKGRPPKTIHSAIHAVKSFLMEYEIELPNKFWHKLARRTKGNRAVTRDEIPTNKELRDILQHGGIKARALFLMLSSSGMRIGEALQLLPEDIDMSRTPTKINIRGEIAKTGNPRITFISEEATEALEAWLRGREQYIDYAIKKTNFKNKKSPDDPRVFPFKYNTARTMWNNLLEKAGYDERDPRTDRHKMHIHTLRKYFRTRMSITIPPDVVEALMGHEENLTYVYRRYSEQQLAEMYIKAEQQIVVFKTPLDTTEIEKRLGKLRSENLQLRQDLDRVMDMVISGNSIYLDDNGFLSGMVRWKTYEDGSKQIVEFDKEKREFIPVGRRIPAEEVMSPDWQIIELEEVYNHAKANREKQKL